jgi:hypothetical protein
VIRAVGEVVQLGGAWGLSFALAPGSQAGLYQSFFSTGYSSALVVAPLVWTAVATPRDALGWLLVAGPFVVAGQLALFAARLADRFGVGQDAFLPTTAAAGAVVSPAAGRVERPRDNEAGRRSPQERADAWS